jgi:DNA-binding response OmpR family regulator
MREGHAEILIVDNDERIVELVAWFLKKRGYDVRTAGSFAAAKEHIVQRRPDLMLSDIDLGSESALTELPRLDAGGLLPPTLVVSGYLDPTIREELDRLAPVLDTLAKPFDFPVLEQRVLACLERAAAGEGETGEGSGAGPVEDGSDEGWIEIIPAPRPGTPTRA